MPNAVFHKVVQVEDVDTITLTHRHLDSVVRKSREILGASQALFAQFLGVAAQTMRSWEQGINTPNDIVRRFMDEIRRDPHYWRNRFRGTAIARLRSRKGVLRRQSK